MLRLGGMVVHNYLQIVQKKFDNKRIRNIKDFQRSLDVVSLWVSGRMTFPLQALDW